MLDFLLFGVKRDVHPRAMKIGCFDTNTGFDQHLCGLNTVRFHTDALGFGTDYCKHFASDLPRIISPTEGIGQLGTGKSLAKLVYEFSIHRRGFRAFSRASATRFGPFYPQNPAIFCG